MPMPMPDRIASGITFLASQDAGCITRSMMSISGGGHKSRHVLESDRIIGRGSRAAVLALETDVENWRLKAAVDDLARSGEQIAIQLSKVSVDESLIVAQHPLAFPG